MPSRFSLMVVVAVLMSGQAAAQTPAKVVKIGVGGPLTTTSAGFGVEMRRNEGHCGGN
jgi:branched-chain amino acid transport system substrate-binding protein